MSDDCCVFVFKLFKPCLVVAVGAASGEGPEQGPGIAVYLVVVADTGVAVAVVFVNYLYGCAEGFVEVFTAFFCELDRRDYCDGVDTVYCHIGVVAEDVDGVEEVPEGCY